MKAAFDTPSKQELFEQIYENEYNYYREEDRRNREGIQESVERHASSEHEELDAHIELPEDSFQWCDDHNHSDELRH